MVSNDAEGSRDTLFHGDLICYQKKDGYRFSVDAILLAHFVRPHGSDRVLDLGAGCGIISLILAYRYATLTITALELQVSLARLMERNIGENHLQGRIVCQEGDFCSIHKFLLAEQFDLVVSNPPYYRHGSGRINPGDEAAVARHELRGDIAQSAAAAAFVLKNRGQAAFVYPASRVAVLFSSLKENRLEPKRLQVVHSYPGAPGTLIMVEAVKNGGEGLAVEPPLYIYQKAGGEYSPEVAQMYRANST